jgi:hypothetical protein
MSTLVYRSFTHFKKKMKNLIKDMITFKLSRSKIIKDMITFKLSRSKINIYKLERCEFHR